jgi:hypothetical protein
MSFASGPSYDDLIGLDSTASLARLNRTVCKGLVMQLIVALRAAITFHFFVRPRLGRKDCYLLPDAEGKPWQAHPDAKNPRAEIREPADRHMTRRSVSFGRMRMRLNIAIGRLLTLAAPAAVVVGTVFEPVLVRCLPHGPRLGAAALLLGLFAPWRAVSLWPLRDFRAPGPRRRSTPGWKPKTGFPIRPLPARTTRSRRTMPSPARCG